MQLTNLKRLRHTWTSEYTAIHYIYNIYTNIRLESKVRGGFLLFISGKLPITEDEGSIFVKYNVLDVVYMIYTMGMSH